MSCTLNEIRQTVQTTIARVLEQPELYGRVTKKKSLLKKCQMTSWLQFAIRHVGDSEAIWKKVLWSDETKTELSE